MKQWNRAAIALTLIGMASPFVLAGDPVETEGSAELVDRIYDISHLQIRETDYASDAVVLLPTSQARIRPHTGTWQSVVDSFLGMLVSVLWEEIEYDGRLIDSSDDGHFYMRAPESTHADVRQLADFFARLCNAETEVELYWVEVPETQVTPVGLVSAKEASDWLGGLPPESVKRDRVSVPPYRPGIVQQVRETPTMVDASVEIAQGTSAVNAEMRTVHSGHWALVHAVPGMGGVQLSMTWADLAQPKFTDVDLKLASYIGAEGQATTRLEQGGAIQLMHQPANLSSSRLFVPEGMASVSRVSVKNGHSTLLIAVPGKAAPVIQEYQLTGPRKDRGVAFLMGSLLPLQTSWSGSGEFGTPFEWNEELCWRNQLDCSDWMSALALDGLADELVEVNQMGGYLLLFTAHGVSRDQLPVAHMELDRAVKRLREWVVARPSYRVTLRGFQSGKGEVFQLQQTVSEGAKATWMCGAERTYIHQFDTEVAQYAAIHDPRVMSVMEGSLIEMTLEPDIQGHLQVQFDARLNVPQGSVEIHSASPLHGDFQRPVYQTTRFSGMQPLSAAKPGELTASFGGQGDDSITIVLSVAPVN